MIFPVGGDKTHPQIVCSPSKSGEWSVVSAPTVEIILWLLCFCCFLVVEEIQTHIFPLDDKWEITFDSQGGAAHAESCRRTSDCGKICSRVITGLVRPETRGSSGHGEASRLYRSAAPRKKELWSVGWEPCKGTGVLLYSQTTTEKVIILNIIIFSGECLAAITPIFHVGPITTNILNLSNILLEIHSLDTFTFIEGTWVVIKGYISGWKVEKTIATQQPLNRPCVRSFLQLLVPENKNGLWTSA